MALAKAGLFGVAALAVVGVAYAARTSHLSIGRSADQDPCTLLSAAEAEAFVGRLASPPYRTADGETAGNANGEQCMYRGVDGRQLTVLPLWGGGGMVGGMLKGIPGAIGKATAGTQGAGLDSLAGRVLQSDAKGPWDNATWIPGGSLFVYKGDAQIRIDVSGASGQKSDALAIAKKMVPRVGKPLSYDGARAVAMAPKAKKHSANACDVISRAAVEGAIGKLNSEPERDPDDAAKCTYRVSTSEGVRSYPVEFVWEGGQKNYNMLKHGMAAMGEVGMPGAGVMDTLNLPPEAKQMLGGLMKMVSGGNKSSGNGATGAVTQVGLKTDTTLKGPWDSASLLHGTQLIAVKGDVFVGMSLESADYEKAKALLSAIFAHL
ncbi:MAG: hypothetical protein ABJC26_15365 [Gemmatimonadaceae bacterium]